MRIVWRGLALLVCWLMVHIGSMAAATPFYPAVTPIPPGAALAFPRDHGAHPDYRIEWWYVTGWLRTADGADLGFQVTFFRNRPEVNQANPSRFAPRQLIFAHAALADGKSGRFLHDQRVARAGFGVAAAASGDADVKVDRWAFRREAGGNARFLTRIPARDFTLELAFAPQQPPLLQGENGYSRKGAKPEQASYYYSLPQLAVTGTVQRDGRAVSVTGTAWLDHEWSSTLLDPRAAGWDWTGINFADGGALMAFRIRGRDGATLFATASLRGADGRITRAGPEAVRFRPLRTWRSPHTGASYPVEQELTVGTGASARVWRLLPLLDDQELDSRASSGVVYWEGATRALDTTGREAGQGYLELTGYFQALRL